MSSSNQFEQSAREEKCRQIARYILSQAIRVVGKMEEHEWVVVAKDAKVNLPSPESRKRIIQILESIAV